MVDAALRARRRQYEIRNYIEERKRSEEELRRATEALRQSREGLEQQVQQRTAALRRLSSTLIGIQDNERRRIARELHDSLGQYLTAITMQLATLQAAAGPALQKGLAEAQSTAHRCILETRTLSHLLHPPLLDEMGLETAVRWYVQGFAERSGVKINLEVESPIERMQREAEVMFFRVLQESLTNIHKHSGSQTAEVTLVCSDDAIVLEVRDFGCGMPGNLLDRFLASGEGTGVGLAGIRERVNDLGGQLEIESGTTGTLVRVSLAQKGKPATTMTGK
jgi:signal transduction histidine kinase